MTGSQQRTALALGLLAAVALAGCLGGVPGLDTDGTGEDATTPDPADEASAAGDGAAQGNGTTGDAASSPFRDRPATVTIREVVRAQRLVDGPRVHRPPDGHVYVALDVALTTTDGVGKATVDPRLVTGHGSYSRHDERLQPTQLVGPIAVGDGGVEGRVIYTVPTATEPEALRIDATPATSGAGAGSDDAGEHGASGTAATTWNVTIGDVARLDHEAGDLAIVGHDVFTRETLSRKHVIRAVLPRVRNVGGLPVNVTGVKVVLGEQRASCTADTAVPPGVTQTISAACDWDGYLGSDRPEFDPGNYSARLTVLEEGTVVVSATTTVTVP